MGTTNDNQDITSEAPKLLLCSSIASASDPGSNAVTKPQAGIGKEHPELSWYYMYLPYKELKRYIAVFSGRKAVKLRTSEGITEECYFCFKVFSYTEAGHRKRFEQCDYTKQEYAARRESARIVKEAFSTGSASQLNALTDEKEVQGSGWLFGATSAHLVCHAPPPISGNGLRNPSCCGYSPASDGGIHLSI